MKNLAPQIVRQRVIIEATTRKIAEPAEIGRYLVKLSELLGMRPLRQPYTYPAEDKGFGGWIHWVTSGCHVYSYFADPPLVTVDAYTCKPFDSKKAAEFTAEFFNATELVWKEVKVDQ